MVNNFERFAHNLLTFQSEDEFYSLQIMSRKKDGGPKPTTIHKTVLVNNSGYLLSKALDIMAMCNDYGARAMISVSPRSYRKTAIKASIEFLSQVEKQDFRSPYATVTSVIAKNRSPETPKRWLLDVDEPEFSMLGDIVGCVEECLPENAEGDRKLIDVLPSKSGWHVITKPFDPREFNKEWPQVEIKKDNTTNLYIP